MNCVLGFGGVRCPYIGLKFDDFFGTGRGVVTGMRIWIHW